jgi:tetratricopeptide (TPR) repeat protein
MSTEMHPVPRLLSRHPATVRGMPVARVAAAVGNVASARVVATMIAAALAVGAFGPGRALPDDPERTSQPRGGGPFPTLLDRTGPPVQVPDSVSATSDLWTEFCMGLRAEEAGDFDRALQYYRSVHRRTGDDAELLARQAVCFLEKRDPERATEFGRRAVALDSLNQDGLWATSAGLLATGRLPEAVPYLTSLVEENPDYRNLTVLANLLERLRRHEEALHPLNLLVAKHPSSVQLYERRAGIFTRLGRYDEAIADYWAMLDISPEYPKLRELMTTLLKQIGRQGELIRFYQALVAKLPEEKHNHWRLVELLMEAEQWAAAADALDSLRALHPDDPLPVLQLGLVAYRQGQAAQALELILDADRLGIAPAISTLWRMRIHYAEGAADSALAAARELTEIEPQAVEGWRVAGFALAEQGAPAEALPYVERWAELDEADPGPPLLAASLCREMQAMSRGLAFARMALERDPENERVQLELAAFLEATGDLEQATAIAQRILDRDANHPEALNFLGYLWIDRGIRLAEAETLVKRALKLQPDNPAFLDSMGWLWYKRGDLERAEEWLNRAISLGGRHPEIYQHLAQIMLEADRILEAQKTLELGLKWNPRDAALTDFLMSLGDKR